MHLYIYCFLVSLCVVAVALFLSLRVTKRGEYSLIAKTFASLVFVVLGFMSLLGSNYEATCTLITLGLVFGLVGDILLDLKVMHPEKSDAYLNTGMMAFGAGHVMYFFAIVTYISDKVVTGYGWVVLASLVFALLVGALIVRFAPQLKMDFSGYKVQNWLYSSVLIFMTLISLFLAFIVPQAGMLAAGFILFLASDLILSMQYFGGKQESAGLTIANHVLYYFAQIMIATFAFFI